MQKLATSVRGNLGLLVLCCTWLISSPWNALRGMYDPHERTVVLILTPMAWSVLLAGVAGAHFGYWWVLVLALLAHAALSVVRGVVSFFYSHVEDEEDTYATISREAMVLFFRVACVVLAAGAVILALRGHDPAWLVATAYFAIFFAISFDGARRKVESWGRKLYVPVDNAIDSVLVGLLFISLFFDLLLRPMEPESPYE